MSDEKSREAKLSEQAREAVARNSHQMLFYALCEDLKRLTRGKSGAWKRSVGVETILELECQYAEAERRMCDEKVSGTGGELMDAVALMDACKREYDLAKRGGYKLPLMADLPTALGVVACMQLALRHPENSGPTAKIARGIVAAIIRRAREDGFVACADLMELGNDPAKDVVI